MTLTDQKAIKMLEKARLWEVAESIYNYPEDEREGRSDFQMLADEASYMYSCYYEDGHCFHDDLMEAKEKLRETNYGKRIPLDSRTFRPKHGYWPSDIQNCKNAVNEFNRLKRFVERLEKLGYIGKW